MKKIRVAAAIILQNNQVLATQRLAGQFAGFWEFPGGKVELNETLNEALIREIKEELKAEIQIDSHFLTITHQYPDFHLTLDCFVCQLLSDYSLVVHTQAKWVNFNTIDSLNWLPANLPIVEKIKTQLFHR